MATGSNGKVRFTPTEERLLAVLGDGEPHDRAELVACLWDNEGVEHPSDCWKAVKWHLTTLRKRLRPERKEIVCQVINRQFKYRLMGLLGRD